MKTNISLAFSFITFVYINSFTHPNIKNIEIVPEIIPDLKITYRCDSSYEIMEDIHMVRNADNTVTANYGGYGRRKGLRNFKCNAPLTTGDGSSR